MAAYKLDSIVFDLDGTLWDTCASCAVASGIKELAAQLPLYIVSNCQSGYIETFLRKSGLGAYFNDFECWGNTGKSKSLNLQNLIDRNGLKKSVYVGDTVGDQTAALGCDVPFWFGSYGFGECTEYSFKFSSFLELLHHINQSA